jgi:hypothetical protein
MAPSAYLSQSSGANLFRPDTEKGATLVKQFGDDTSKQALIWRP